MRLHHRFVVVYLCVGFEEILLEAVMQSRQLMWICCLMVFSRVCEKILIVADADWEGCHSDPLQWHPHLMELTQSNHELSWNAAKV